jgi:hypothetical protein
VSEDDDPALEELEEDDDEEEEDESSSSLFALFPLLLLLPLDDESPLGKQSSPWSVVPSGHVPGESAPLPPPPHPATARSIAPSVAAAHPLELMAGIVTRLVFEWHASGAHLGLRRGFALFEHAALTSR